MEDLVIQKSERTPSVEFHNSGDLRIEGRSTPENALEFYEEPLNWIKEFKKTKPQKVDLHVSLEFFNTSTSKLLLHLFKQLDHFKDGSEAQIFWYHEKSDDDMQEAGEDYKSILKLPFHIIELES